MATIIIFYSSAVIAVVFLELSGAVIAITFGDTLDVIRDGIVSYDQSTYFDGESVWCRCK